MDENNRNESETIADEIEKTAETVTETVETETESVPETATPEAVPAEEKPRKGLTRSRVIAVVAAVLILAGVVTTVLGVLSSKKNAKKNTDTGATEEPKVTIPMTGTAAPTPTEPAGTKSFLSVYEIKDQTGTVVEHYSHNEYGQLTYFDRSDGLTRNTYYELGGVREVETQNGKKTTRFYRDKDEPLPGEVFDVPGDDYVLKLDERGYWDSVGYVNNNGIYIKQEYDYNDEGMLYQTKTWVGPDGTEDGLMLIIGATYAYDGEGRLKEYSIINLLDSNNQNGVATSDIYRFEYTDNSKKITKTRWGQTLLSEEWIYEANGTMHIQKSYDGDKAQMVKYWIIPMPESYKEVRVMSVGLDQTFDESIYPIDFVFDTNGRLEKIVANMPDQGLVDYLIFSFKYYGDGLLESISDLHGATTKFEYDIHGDVIRTTASDRTGTQLSVLDLTYDRIVVKETE